MTNTITLTQALQLATHYHKTGQLVQAKAIYHQILQLEPNNAAIAHLLGIIATQQKDFVEATTWFRQAIHLNNTVPDFYTHLGYVLWEQTNAEGAVQAYQQALELNPHHFESLYNLGNIFKNNNQVEEALRCYQLALSVNPNFVNIYNNLAELMKATGAIQEAIQYYSQALELDPSCATVHQNLLFTLNYALGYDREKIFAEHQLFNKHHALPLANQIKPHINQLNRNKKLKIGYVSPDFRHHSVAYFIEPLLQCHDREQFEVYCYYNHTIYDNETARLQQFADHWIDCHALSDEELAENIRQTPIDILIDLAGHTDNNRLLVFARKPAPIQITYLGYPNTTGLTAIDYRISDRYVDPEGVGELFNSEQLLRMPASFFCYRPLATDLPVSELPYLTNNYITFSSFNTYTKINFPLLTLWSQVLHALPRSKLLMQAQSLHATNIRHRFIQQMGELGIEPDRLIFAPYMDSVYYLKTYHQVDIALDSYPFNGGTTTCEALWMGIPVVSLTGDTTVSRMGLSILSAVNLEYLSVHTPQEYVDVCVGLAKDINRLQKLRSTLRNRMIKSPLMDTKMYVQHLETFYRSYWQSYCDKRV